MNTKQKLNTSEARAEQAASKKYQSIKLGIDWHADQYRVVRIIDGAGPEPAQRFMPTAFLGWAKKQLGLAERVYSCYEAGPGGFVLHRQLTELGVTDFVVHPVNLDAQHKRVATDKTDCRQLVLNLDRFLHGSDKALCPVYVPTAEEEQRRARVRQREQLRKERHRLAMIGRSLLLSQGWRENTRWWQARWESLADQLPGWLREQL